MPNKSIVTVANGTKISKDTGIGNNGDTGINAGKSNTGSNGINGENEKLRRINRTTLLFNTREKDAINLYCQKYKIKNKSKFMREAIMTSILKKFDEDYPTLFEFEKPNLFYQK